MSNSIALAELYKPILDELYKQEALTSEFENNNAFIKATDDPAIIQIARIEMQGLGDYSRANGYVAGDVTLEWDPYRLQHDRGRSFQVDAMDNREAINMPLLHLVAQFMRTKVIPEIDSIRFAQNAAAGGTLETAALANANDAVDAIMAAIEAMDNAEVPDEGRRLYMAPRIFHLIKKSDYWMNTVAPGQNPNRNYGEFDGVPIRKVAPSRFYTAVQLLTGGSGQEAGGYQKGATGLDIDFQLVHLPAVAAVTKHALPRIFGPEVNQKANATLFDYRIYHDIFTPTNKTVGIYTHAEPVTP